MDLMEIYEADLADYILQEIPFYDTVIPMSKSIIMKLKTAHDGKKKPRKSVSFLPNYVQVRLIFIIFIFIISFVYLYYFKNKNIFFMRMSRSQWKRTQLDDPKI